MPSWPSTTLPGSLRSCSFHTTADDTYDSNPMSKLKPKVSAHNIVSQATADIGKLFAMDAKQGLIKARSGTAGRHGGGRAPTPPLKAVPPFVK